MRPSAVSFFFSHFTPFSRLVESAARMRASSGSSASPLGGSSGSMPNSVRPQLASRSRMRTQCRTARSRISAGIALFFLPRISAARNRLTPSGGSYWAITVPRPGSSRHFAKRTHPA